LNSNGHHPVQPISYFEDAIGLIGDYENIFIFSDDIKWCKENINFKNSIFVEGNTNIEDLWLMSLCTNNVISNSSFSWWSAYINNNSKKIIYPKNWFGDFTNINTSLICPREWTQL
jgi:hypothetical protein